MHGGDDKIADPAVPERVFADLSSTDKELEIWPDLRHEIFNEVERQEVFDRVGAWLDARV